MSESSPLLSRHHGPGLWQVRGAVREWLAKYPPSEGMLCVALSGGADSLALTAAVTAECALKKTSVSVTALIVDHQLQNGSARVAAEAAQQALQLGCSHAQVLTVTVTGDGGLEAAARQARRVALQQASNRAPILLGHTLDDQAETVLLGLGRGSGPRSVQGMQEWDSPWGRPLLSVRRAETRAACVEMKVEPYEDPMNADPRFTRVRLRNHVLPLLEEVLQGGVAEALTRTARALREDNHYLDECAAQEYEKHQGAELSIAVLKNYAPPIRRRIVRLWLLHHGVTTLRESQLLAIDALIVEWRGQGGVAVPTTPGAGGRVMAQRVCGSLRLISEPAS